MGTTLTGTTPQDTYDSLIKVTDNGPLSGTAKYLSDGLGNDSVLALSTGAAGIATTTIVSGTKLTVGGPTSTLGSAGTPSVYLTNDTGASGTAQQYATLGTASTAIATLFRGNGSSGTTANGLNIDNFGGFQVRVNQLGGSGDSINLLGGNVGIGTSSPVMPLELAKNSSAGLTGSVYYSARFLQDKTNYKGVFLGYDTSGTIGVIGAETASPASRLAFYTYSGSTWGERVGITSNGLTFNGDTAAANALDDYEEGTFTPTVRATSGAATYTNQFGSYTKIGRQVTVNWFISFQKNTLSGEVGLGNLPFTLGSFSGLNYPQAIILLDNLASAYTNPLLQLVNGTTNADIIINNGSTGSHAAMSATQLGAGTMEFRGTATYFV